MDTAPGRGDMCKTVCRAAQPKAGRTPRPKIACFAVAYTARMNAAFFVPNGGLDNALRGPS